MSISRLFEIQQMSFSKSNNFHIFDVLGNSCKFKSREKICYYQALIYCTEFSIRKHGWRCSSFQCSIYSLDFACTSLRNGDVNIVETNKFLPKQAMATVVVNKKSDCIASSFKQSHMWYNLCVIENIFKIVGNVPQFDKHCVSWKIIIIETNTRSLRFVFQLCHFNMCFLF